MVPQALIESRGVAMARLATAFYAALAFASVLYAFVFGHLDTLLGERAADGAGLFRGLWIGFAIVVISHAAHRLFRFAREASRVIAEFVGPLSVSTAIYLAVISGFAEELCFRGALWPHLGLAGTTLLFGILHAVPVRALAAYPIFAALAGLVFGTLRESTGSVWPPALAHAAVNAINLAVLGRLERSRLRQPAAPEIVERSEPADAALRMPNDIRVEETFPVTIWRYDLRVELRGTDRETLRDCLEHEQLALFGCVTREEVYEQLAAGLFVFTHSFTAPFAAFPADVATISSYLFQTLNGIEVAERYTDRDTTDDVRAWKTVAQRGEWVKVPLLVENDAPGKFFVDPDHEDEEVLIAHWTEYPRWFQDGMRFKYPRLRDL